MTILDASVEDPGPVVEADVCVVGSGPAGSTVAVSLAGRGLRVVVLEAGPATPPFSVASDVVVQRDRHATIAGPGLAEALGGSSTLWAGRIAPLDRVDLEPRTWVPGSGWPIPYDELAGFTDRAAATLGVADLRRATARSIVPGHGAGKTLEVKAFVFAPRTYRARDVLLAAAANPATPLTVLVRAPVARLCTDLEVATIREAEIAGVSGVRTRVRARTFVLAAGGLQTPRLLLTSGDPRLGGLGNRGGAVGRYLGTHPKGTVAMFMPDGSRFTRAEWEPSVSPAGIVHRGLRLSAELQRDLSLRNHHVQLRRPPAPARALRRRLLAAIRRAEGSPDPGDVPVTGRLRDLDGVGPLVVRGYLEDVPSRANRVVLLDARDAFGRPRIAVERGWSRADAMALTDWLAGLDTALRSAGLGRLRPLPSRVVARRLVGAHSHFLGTTRMGSDPQDAVVDADCRVHDTANLYVAGPSVFPTYGSANPMMTILALAHRIADRIAVDYGIADTAEGVRA